MRRSSTTIAVALGLAAAAMAVLLVGLVWRWAARDGVPTAAHDDGVREELAARGDDQRRTRQLTSVRRLVTALASVLDAAPTGPAGDAGPADPGAHGETTVSSGGRASPATPERPGSAGRPPALGRGAAGDQSPPCDPGPVALSLVRRQVDLVVAIDTSGSMYEMLPDVGEWLHQSLEPALRRASESPQLMVIAHLERIRQLMARRGRELWSPSEAGLHLPHPVSSTDALAVLLRSAADRQEASWLARLRPDAEVHLVIVTDDSPSARVNLDFLERITALAEGRLGTAAQPRFHLHGLLGIALPATAPVLPPDAPVVEVTCGVRPGQYYQRLAQATGGLRGSVCRRQAMDTFAVALGDRIAAGQGKMSCAVALPATFPAAQLVSLRALAADGLRELPLQRSFDPSTCATDDNKYQLQGHELVICPQTCRRLEAARLVVAEALGRCPR